MILFAIYIMLWHWFADFILQTHDMSINKSKSNYWLSLHVFYYGLGITPVALLVWFWLGLNGWYVAICWLILNCILHWGVDYITSRITSDLYAKKDFHNFFVVIGFDQFLHTVCLIITFYLSVA